MAMIITSECEYCKYGKLDETDKANIKVHCAARNKTYSYGQRIPCDDKSRRK